MKHYTFIIFGGTGDLAKRKLFPAIIAIVKKNPEYNITVLGIGRREYTKQEYIERSISETDLPKNLVIDYFIADVEKPNALKDLKQKLESLETAEVTGRIYYLATSSNLFGNIAKSIHSCCSEHKETFTRIIAEKPFGNDLKSSKKLNKTLRKYFSEEQLYRADHYLAKDTIDNIVRLRLSNPLFESIWNSKSVHRIKMVVDEELGVGNRIKYYDEAGALKDMFQNHMLETLSVVLMEPPISLDDKDFEKSKVEAIKKLYFKDEILTGQYQGYKEEIKGINPGSKTETFVELKLHSKAKRWKGTEIVLRTGKMLKKREAYIEIEFKKEPCMLYCTLGSAPNKLIIHIQPSDNIELTMNTTLPGEKMNVTPVKMTFSPSNEFSANSSEGYEVILEECMLGNKRIFIGDKELDVAWSLTDKIAKFMKEVTPIEYAHASSGPEWKKK